ncbi:MAG: molybdopterin-binding protein [Firmicutes bacterium]|nr:molybdopterin-binding protein [Bacillota bacterium]
MKLIKTEDAVGHVLCHDMTQIIKGQTKDALFRKGHIVTEEDIPLLLSIGKDHLYVWEKEPGMLHEDEAAQILWGMIANDNIEPKGPKEGKIDAYAAADGLFKVDNKRLRTVNAAGEMMIASRHGNTPVHKGDKLAGTRIIPLVIREEKLTAVKEQIGDEPLMRILPYQIKKVGVVTTGNEVFYGRIKDTFTPTIVDKLAEYGAEMVFHETFADDDSKITNAIIDMKEKGAEMVVCTGGMSVDPDDKTPLAIKNTGADVISYGSPVLPGAMFLISYLDGVPVLGLPGCVMYAKRNIFDLALPRVLAKDPITAEDLSRLGQGGLCLDCDVCVYPACGFGKGW